MALSSMDVVYKHPLGPAVWLTGRAAVVPALRHLLLRPTIMLARVLHSFKVVSCVTLRQLKAGTDVCQLR